MQFARAITLATISVALLALGHAAQAQQPAAPWKPTGNVEFVVGAGPGGENDRIARAIQRVLTKEHLVDTMTVLNRPGAGQIIAMNYLAGKIGDANEIGLASGSFVNAIARNGSDLNRHLTPIVKLFDAYQCFFTSVDSQFKSMVDVREKLKADPTSVTFAFPVGLGSSLPLILGGKLRMLGIASPERLAGELAKYPTLREQGLDVITANSYTVLMPSGLTPEQIKFWVQALDKVMEDPDFKLDLDRNFWTLQPVRYPEAAKVMQDEYDENRKILTELGMLQQQ